MATCPHAASVNKPLEGVPIHREECCQCFHSPKSEGGLNICMVCFTGGCPTSANGGENHFANHHRVTKHDVYINVVETETAKPVAVETMDHDGAPKTLDSMLEDSIARDSTTSTTTTLSYTAHCMTCQLELSLDPSINPKLAEAVPLVVSAISSSSPLACAETGASSSRSKDLGFGNSLDDTPKPCSHTLSIESLQAATKSQTALPDLSNASFNKCSVEGCSITEDLWLCLTCGALGCSRSNYDGTGGKGHAVAHSTSSNHPLVMKIATLTAAGTADIWCYACDLPVVDPHLSKTLSSFGISLDGRVKTGKSLAEMQVEHNALAHTDSIFSLDGNQLRKISGPGITGLDNIGNSCYMNSTLQALMATQMRNGSGKHPLGFPERYFDIAKTHFAQCTNSRPASCYLCQMCKMANALNKGSPMSHGAKSARYTEHCSASRNATLSGVDNASGVTSQQSSDSDTPSKTVPVPALRMLKRILAKGHEEFLSNRQQCAHEYYGHLIETASRAETALREKGVGLAIEDAYSHFQTTKITCTQCQGVSYHHAKARDLPLLLPAEGDLSSVPFGVCVDKTFQETVLENFSCPDCKTKTTATTKMGLRTFPSVLVVVVRRFGHALPGSWVPVKLTTELTFDGLRAQSPEGNVVTGAIHGTVVDNVAPLLDTRAFPGIALNGPLPGDKLFQNDASSKSAAGSTTLVQVDEETALNVSMMLGVDIERVAHALRQCDNDPDRAVDWIFSHMDEAIPSESASSAGAGTADAGDANIPAFETGATYILRSFVSHQGNSTASGHYVSHVFEDRSVVGSREATIVDGQTGDVVHTNAPGWVCFNDQRCSVNPQPPIGGAYLYFFEKVPSSQE